ncbi:flagellar motor switch protein FliG [Nostoc sp. NIES-2111]
MPPIVQRRFSGPERAAIVLLALGEEYGRVVWERLDDEEVRTISAAMAHLGVVESDQVENLIVDFAGKMGAGSVTGDMENTRLLLSRLLPEHRVAQIMEEIGTKSDRSTWQRLSQLHESVVANYLKTELPQTSALILGRLSSAQAAKVLALLPRRQGAELLDRMLSAGNIARPVMERIEDTLRLEFMTNALRETPMDAVGKVVDIVNQLDRSVEAALLSDLGRVNTPAAERIRSLLFTFDDLVRLDPNATQLLISRTDRSVLARALKGSPDMLRRHFTSRMSTKQRQLLEEEIAVLGPLRLREVDEAQSVVVKIAKGLEAEGLITIPQGKADEDLVY